MSFFVMGKISLGVMKISLFFVWMENKKKCSEEEKHAAKGHLIANARAENITQIFWPLV